MAYFIRDTGNNLTPLQHSYNIFKEYITKNFFSTMIGKRGSGKPIVIDDSVFKGRGAGDVGRWHFIPQYKGKGILGQNPSITGNEKTLDEFYMDLRIDQVAQAFKKRGKMTDIRTIWNIREEFKSQLAEWFRDFTETDLVYALTGLKSDGATWIEGASSMSTDLVNGAGRCFRPDYADSKFTTVKVAAADSDGTSLTSAINSGDIMNTYLLDELQSLAKTAGKYAMKPIRAVNNEEYYILVLHPNAAIDLRRDPRWEERAVASMTGKGSLENDPIATGAMGIWGKIIIKEADKIVVQSNAAGTVNVARNLLLGADAAILAYGQNLDYKEEKRDYDREMGMAADEIRGSNKITFDGCDLNVAQVPCFVSL